MVSLAGRGHSSRRTQTAAGPRGSSKGMTSIMDRVTASQPSSLSAMARRARITSGGSLSLIKILLVAISKAHENGLNNQGQEMVSKIGPYFAELNLV